jgi:hypothetical protein
MRRELKRVPLDFDWPLNQTWKGYINPLPSANPCDACQRSGYSPQAKHLSDQWYGYVPFNPRETGSVPFTPQHPAVRAFAERQCQRSPEYYGTGETAVLREAKRLCGHWNASWSHHLDQQDVQALVDAGRLYDFTHTWTGKRWEPRDPLIVPSAAEVNAWSLCGMGHDSINSHVCIKAKCQRLGFPDQCASCDGDGETWESDADRQAYEAWEHEEPPTGVGFQLWQNTSEGSPISAVFPTLDALCEWAAENATTFGDSKVTAAEWRKMLDDGLVCHREGNAIFI